MNGYLIFVTILALQVTFTVSTIINISSCRELETYIGVSTRYAFLNGCMVKVQSNWIPKNSVRWNLSVDK